MSKVRNAGEIAFLCALKVACVEKSRRGKRSFWSGFSLSANVS